MTAADDAFFRTIENGYAPVTTEHLDPTPYGAPAAFAAAGQSPKPGLTTRGKAAIAIGATVIAGGSLLGYQSYAASTAQADLKARELALKADALELEKLKILNQTQAVDKQTQTEQATARQKAVDTCVKGLKNQVGHGYGSPTYGEIVEDCQSQYPATTNTADMQAAASATDTTSTGNQDGGGIGNGALLGVLGLGAVAAYGANKGRRNATAA